MNQQLMIEKRRIAILGYEGADLVDITGPFEVFATATALAPEFNMAKPYEVELLSGDGSTIRTDAGLSLVADKSIEGFNGADTLLVAGGGGKFVAQSDPTILELLSQWRRKVRRIGSV